MLESSPSRLLDDQRSGCRDTGGDTARGAARRAASVVRMDDELGPVGHAVVFDLLDLVGVPSETLRLFEVAARKERARRVSVALRAAEDLTGRSRETLALAVSDSPQMLSLTIRVLLAAGNSGNDAVLQMLGQSLGRAYKTESATGEQELLVSAIEGLTQEQLIVLAACDSKPRPMDEVVERCAGKLSPELVEMATMSLVPRGMFDNPFGRFGGAFYPLSALGVAVRDAAVAAYPTVVEDSDEDAVARG